MILQKCSCTSRHAGFKQISQTLAEDKLYRYLEKYGRFVRASSTTLAIVTPFTLVIASIVMGARALSYVLFVLLASPATSV